MLQAAKSAAAKNIAQHKASAGMCTLFASTPKTEQAFYCIYMVLPLPQNGCNIRKHWRCSVDVRYFTHSRLLQASAMKEHEQREELETKIAEQVDTKKLLIISDRYREDIFFRIYRNVARIFLNTLRSNLINIFRRKRGKPRNKACRRSVPEFN